MFNYKWEFGSEAQVWRVPDLHGSRATLVFSLGHLGLVDILKWFSNVAAHWNYLGSLSTSDASVLGF